MPFKGQELWLLICILIIQVFAEAHTAGASSQTLQRVSAVHKRGFLDPGGQGVFMKGQVLLFSLCNNPLLHGFPCPSASITYARLDLPSLRASSALSLRTKEHQSPSSRILFLQLALGLSELHSPERITGHLSSCPHVVCAQVHAWNIRL